MWKHTASARLQIYLVSVLLQAAGAVRASRVSLSRAVGIRSAVSARHWLGCNFLASCCVPTFFQISRRCRNWVMCNVARKNISHQLKYGLCVNNRIGCFKKFAVRNVYLSVTVGHVAFAPNCRLHHSAKKSRARATAGGAGGGSGDGGAVRGLGGHAVTTLALLGPWPRWVFNFIP